MKTVRPTKARKAFASAFNAGCAKIAVEKFGARKLEDARRFDYHTSDLFQMDTRYGVMRIWPETGPESVLDGLHKGSFFTAFCRFETHDRVVLRAAADQLDSNPFSGKYNFHVSCGNTQSDLEAALRAFERHLAAVAVS